MIRTVLGSGAGAEVATSSGEATTGVGGCDVAAGWIGAGVLEGGVTFGRVAGDAVEIEVKETTTIARQYRGNCVESKSKSYRSYWPCLEKI